jgi:hexosaminidase
MAIVSEKLSYIGLEHNSSTAMMLERMSGKTDAEELRILATAVQPPRGYAREELKQYTALTPLNRLVDAVPPESETARRFNQLASLIAAGKASPQQWQEAQAWLVRWRDNDAKLQPSLSDSELTQELAPVSQSLSQVAGVGLQALDDLKEHRAVSADARDKNLQLLKDAEKPQAVLLDMVAPSVEILVEAAIGRQ